MKANIIRIGNSQGVRIPKVLLEQTRLSGEVEMEVRGNTIIIKTASRPRKGWEEKFKSMAERGDDRLLDVEQMGQTSFDDEEWLW
ncbi:MAG TPA: AbrB/MazE/SpoVT family DNA-binding domain-containing protein [Candidatus Deferrimicrobiaceae bacterium]|jgi:antitoxin MazE|nr:AbrB/MazE/SpoVT family DNA-binding domain-containing protein [Candidatus Deferrimicrobiaceae bacterium]